MHCSGVGDGDGAWWRLGEEASWFRQRVLSQRPLPHAQVQVAADPIRSPRAGFDRSASSASSMQTAHSSETNSRVRICREQLVERCRLSSVSAAIAHGRVMRRRGNRLSVVWLASLRPLLSIRLDMARIPLVSPPSHSIAVCSLTRSSSTAAITPNSRPLPSPYPSLIPSSRRHGPAAGFDLRGARQGGAAQV